MMPDRPARWEHYEHGADIGVRGIGATEAAAFEQAAFGVGLGSMLTYLFSLGFPPTVPLAFDGTRVAMSILALILIGPIGGLVSVVYAVRIEPLRALRLQ